MPPQRSVLESDVFLQRSTDDRKAPEKTCEGKRRNSSTGVGHATSSCVLGRRHPGTVKHAASEQELEDTKEGTVGWTSSSLLGPDL